MVFSCFEIRRFPIPYPPPFGSIDVVFIKLPRKVGAESAELALQHLMHLYPEKGRRLAVQVDLS